VRRYGPTFYISFVYLILFFLPPPILWRIKERSFAFFPLLGISSMKSNPSRSEKEIVFLAKEESKSVKKGVIKLRLDR